MTSDKFKEAQLRLGLTNEQAAAAFRVSIRTIEKWRQGTRSIPGPTIVVIDLLDRYKGSVKYLLDRATKHGDTTKKRGSLRSAVDVVVGHYPLLAGHAIALRECADRAPNPDRIKLQAEASAWEKFACDFHSYFMSRAGGASRSIESAVEHRKCLEVV